MEHVEMHSRVQPRHLVPMWARPEFPGATVLGQEQVASVMQFSHPSAFPHPSRSLFPSSLLPQSNVTRRSLSLEGPDGVRGTGHTASWAGQAAQCLKAPRPVHNRVPSIHMFMPEEATRATSHKLCSRDPRPCLCCGVPTNEMS